MRHFLCILLCAFVWAACSSVRPADAPPQSEAQAAPVPRATLTDSAQRLFDELYLESVVEGLAGRTGVQFELLQAALSLDADAPEALADIASLYGGRTSAFDKSPQDTVAALLGRAVRLAPDNLYYRRSLAAALYARGDKDGCIAQLEQISGRDRDEQLLLMLARLYAERGDTPKALTSLDEIDRRDGVSEQTAMMRFYLFIRNGDNEHAYAALENLCAAYPDELDYRVLLGDAYAQMGYHEMALATYEDVLAAEPDNSAARIALLEHYRRTNQYALYREQVAELVLNPRVPSSLRTEAMTGYVRQAVVTRPDSTEVKHLFRQALALPQDDDEMWKLYLTYLSDVLADVPRDTITAVAMQAVEARPECISARKHCMSVMLERNDLESLVRFSRGGREVDSTEILCYYFEIAALFSLQRSDEAETLLQKALSIASSERFPSAEHTEEEQKNDLYMASDLAGMYADVLYERGKHAEAYALYEKALGWQPDNLGALNNFAYYLSISGDDLPRALRMGRQLVEAEPENAVYLDTYAWALYLDGQYAEAFVYITEALRCDTEQNYIYTDHAGDIAFRLGRKSEALRYWRRALKTCTERAERNSINRKIIRKRL